MQVELTLHLKTAVGATPPRVRISPLPPFYPNKIGGYDNCLGGASLPDRGAKREQKVAQRVYSIYKIEYSDSAMFALRSGGAA